MGTFSKIDHSFWQDDFVLSLTPAGRYFFNYLISNGRTNAVGCYEMGMIIAGVETGYSVDTIKELLGKLVSSGKVLFDDETNEVLIVNWKKYHWTKQTGNVNSMLKDFKKVKSPLFKEILAGFLAEYGIMETENKTEGLETAENNEEQQETKEESCTVDIDVDIDIDIDKEKDMVEDGLKELKEKVPSDQQKFDQFWKLYPNKKAKAAALRRWKAMKISNETFQAILEGLQKALGSQEWAKDGGAYIPHPATWLNGGCWEDEYKPLVTARTRSDTTKDSAINLRRQMLGLGDENG